MTESCNYNIHDRRLDLKGAVNFRDIGGIPCSDGLLVTKGLVYRSDHLSRLTANDQQILQQLNFKTVCDLRSVKEQHQSPDRLPDVDSIHLYSLPVQAKHFDPAMAFTLLQKGDDTWLTMDFLCNLYRNYIDDFGDIWGKTLSLIASQINLPLVFHCTGGKDRTGILSALLLKFLGGSEDQIFIDHDLSNVCNAERLKPIYSKFEEMGIETQKADLYLKALPEPLAAMFDHLKQNYGSVENYLRTKANLSSTTLTALQTILLQ